MKNEPMSIIKNDDDDDGDDDDENNIIYYYITEKITPFSLAASMPIYLALHCKLTQALS